MRLVAVLLALLAASFLFWQSIQNDLAASASNVIVKKQAHTMDMAYEKNEARAYLNEIRQSMGMSMLSENEKLDRAAQAHADYLIANDESAHEEIPGHKGFTGVSPKERALKAGYDVSYVSENLSTKNNSGKSSIDGLFSAIYHRFGFLDVAIDQIGVGAAQDPSAREKSAFVYLMGNSELEVLCSTPAFKGSGKYVYKVCREPEHRIAEKRFNSALNHNRQLNPKIILYPYDGQEEVPPAFYSEVPDPLPDYEVSGFPVSVVFNDYYFKKVDLVSFKLFTPDGKEVEKVRFMDKSNDPHHRFTAHQFALFPLERLEYGTRYRAEIIYRTPKGREHLSWSFETQRPTEKLHTITKREETVSLDPMQAHLLYFRPLGPHDIISDIRFPADVDISFVDNHTLKISAMPEGTQDFDITSASRTVHVKVQ
ncbi:hypothetical protein YH65_06075 [Sulfurovum lithotrophicum]|uniref:SCP domain-containing protein n=1 Tax=Sulfurovum lithotrophicum TaxID=206403 RepID=A0A7U4M194_9BACT|nr:CAP domain-containing protein [Sulfurovum lithotrophicum]AKF25006.1 hypothetical protein YH65_06075 [Sulfurovum lithotrophicum]